MLEIKFSSKMKADIKRMKKRGKDLQKLHNILSCLARREPLPDHNRDHFLLGGRFKDSRECHIEPDWLLIYKIIDDKLILYATDTGTHADLFR
jgi:mRNA interferase YafQ